MSKEKLTHFDTFSGFGGFSLALQKVYGERLLDIPKSRGQGNEQLQFQEDSVLLTSQPNERQGATTIGFSEIDKYASAVLKYHWPNTKNYGDITKINWAEVPDFDILTGGSPCQDLSIAGKREGLDGRRSGLFYEYMRAIKEKKPKYFIWENVKGALSSQRGWDFGRVINEMAETGYSLWWQVLNAKDFGVPQNRERIFIVGFRDGSPREVFFERPNTGETDEPVKRKRLTTGRTRNFGSSGQLHAPDETCSTLTQSMGTGGNNVPNIINTAQGGNRQPKIIRQRPEYTDGVRGLKNYEYTDACPALSTNCGHGDQKNMVCQPVLTPDRAEKRQNGRRMKGDGEPSFTLTSQDKHGIYNGSRIRRLTPTECERLMGLPDNWLKYGLATKEIICYNLDSNNNNYLNVCKQSEINKIKSQNVKWQVVKENKKPTSVIVLCTTSGGKDGEQQNSQIEKNSPMNTETVNVSIVKKKLESSDHWECVADIIKCNTSTETRYILKRNVPSRVVADTYEKQTELIPTEELWKNILEENCDMTKLSTTLIAINLIIESLIFTFAHVENIRLCIKGLPDSSSEVLKWEVLNLEVDVIEEMSDSVKYKMAGNGVVVNVVEELIKQLII